jgi:hypothetical protein
VEQNGLPPSKQAMTKTDIREGKCYQTPWGL